MKNIYKKIIVILFILNYIDSYSFNSYSNEKIERKKTIPEKTNDKFVNFGNLKYY